MASDGDARPADWLPDGDHRQGLVAGLVILVGLALLAHPLYLWPHYGQTSVGVHIEELSEPPETAVEFDRLPPEARSAVRQEVAGGTTVLWTGDDDQAIEALDGGVNVRYRGMYYRVLLTYGHGGDFVPVLLRWMLTAAAAFLVAYGVLVQYAGSWRPLTPVRSLWVPVAVTGGFLATAWYDVTLSGVAGSFLSITGGLPGLDLIEIIPITSVFLAVGSGMARHGQRAAAGGAVGVLLLVFARFGSFHPVAMLALTAYTAVGGAPWLALGLRLTEAD